MRPHINLVGASALRGYSRPEVPPKVMAVHETIRTRAATYRAARLYPGPVGELLANELLAYEAMGYLGESCLMNRLVQHVMTAPLAAS